MVVVVIVDFYLHPIAVFKKTVQTAFSYGCSYVFYLHCIIYIIIMAHLQGDSIRMPSLCSINGLQ